MRIMVRRDDVQVGPYAYRVLRPAAGLRRTALVLLPGVDADGRRTIELTTDRRDAVRLLRVGSLAGAAHRTLVYLPVRHLVAGAVPAGGQPVDLVLVDAALAFPAERWSDVRQRLGAGTVDRAAACPSPQPKGSAATLELRGGTAVVYASAAGFAARLAALAGGAPSVDLGRRGALRLRVAQT